MQTVAVMQVRDMDSQQSGWETLRAFVTAASSKHDETKGMQTHLEQVRAISGRIHETCPCLCYDVGEAREASRVVCKKLESTAGVIRF